MEGLLPCCNMEKRGDGDSIGFVYIGTDMFFGLRQVACAALYFGQAIF